MDSSEIEGEFNDTLQEDAAQFGGEGQSSSVPTYHVRITSADLAYFVDTREPLVIDSVAFVHPNNIPNKEPDADFTAFVSEKTLQRLAAGKVVNYGIRDINGENQTLHVSKGGVSDLFEDERTPTERCRDMGLID